MKLLIQTTFFNTFLKTILTFDVSICNMITSFGTKDTEKIWLGERVKKLPSDIQETGRRKLRMLNNSQTLADLTIPPSNKLEKLKGNYRNFYSIRINDQWRIIFKWQEGNAYEVKIVDYH
ncbi:MAG: type II toxin-antitoxin system RelE/ParE family toxin [Niabella sp.]